MTQPAANREPSLRLSPGARHRFVLILSEPSLNSSAGLCRVCVRELQIQARNDLAVEGLEA